MSCFLFSCHSRAGGNQVADVGEFRHPRLGGDTLRVVYCG